MTLQVPEAHVGDPDTDPDDYDGDEDEDDEEEDEEDDEDEGPDGQKWYVRWPVTSVQPVRTGA